MNTAQSQKFFKIGEASKLLGLSSETLRRWEKAGKVSFSRTPGGKRLFSEADLDAIRHLLEPIQTSTYQSSNLSVRQPERITLSISVPKLSFPKVNFTKIAVVVLILTLISGNIFLFSKTPYSQQAVLGVETFVAPALEESAPFGNFLSKAGGFFDKFKGGSFIIPIIGKSELSTSGNLEVTGKGHVAKDLQIDKDLKVNGIATVGKLVTGIVDPYLIENDGTVQSSLEIKTLPSSLGSADIVFEPGGLEKLRVKENGNVKVSTSLAVSGDQSLSGNLILSSTSPVISIANTGALKITDGTNTLLSLTDNGTTGNLETTGDLKVNGNITLSGVINSNTFTSTKLVFAGDSPSIYAGTTNTGISLNANGTGAISIGNSSKGDIYLGGGTTSTTRCFVTNSSGNLTCSGDIAVNGGDITTGATTFNLLNSTVTTLNLAGAATSLSLGAAAGTLTFAGSSLSASSSSLTLGGAVSGATTITASGNINSSSGSLQTNGVTRIDNSGNLTAGTGSFAGSITPSLDTSYDLGTAVLRWGNAYFSGDVTAGDVVFKNKFRLTENGDKGIDLLNAKGEKIASFDEDGNFWVKGEIKHGTGN